MKFLICFLVFNSMAELPDITELNSHASTFNQKSYDLHKSHCRTYISNSLIDESKRGNYYIHIMSDSSHSLNVCYGSMLSEISTELKDKGYKTNVQEVGIRGIHFTEVLTIGW